MSATDVKGTAGATSKRAAQPERVQGASCLSAARAAVCRAQKATAAQRLGRRAACIPPAHGTPLPIAAMTKMAELCGAAGGPRGAAGGDTMIEIF